jgi:hypothetical protein
MLAMVSASFFAKHARSTRGACRNEDLEINLSLIGKNKKRQGKCKNTAQQEKLGVIREKLTSLVK